MSKRNNELLVSDIIESAEKIFRYISDLDFNTFSNDDKTIDAVVRNFEIIGEAANRLSEEFKDSNPSIDWHRIRGFRNRIVHDYVGVDLNIIWTIIKEYLPDLMHHLKQL